VIVGEFAVHDAAELAVHGLIGESHPST